MSYYRVTVKVDGCVDTHMTVSEGALEDVLSDLAEEALDFDFECNVYVTFHDHDARRECSCDNVRAHHYGRSQTE